MNEYIEGRYIGSIDIESLYSFMYRYEKATDSPAKVNRSPLNPKPTSKGLL
ncbi:hypothetical protein Cha6605_0280 [Chamaesiphon minutus PCC 6605]|uniref:Uncharacterized protein n=1 Tax=Chamaesiphon minutus (strain ATCC 27169 / PCC 6605) TaxID=1173020 RepID=K9U9R9_CHAP6|nr:hypothetical protein Cha6605_0280 [Chamaesiphon minutus PCC 6605]